VVIWILILLGLGALMHGGQSFGTEASSATLLGFGFLMLSSYFAGKIASRLGLPRLTGYLLVGVITGPHVLDFITAATSDSLKMVSDTAICIIALTAGCELNLKRIRPVMPILRAMTVFAVVGAMIALTAVLFLIRPLLSFFDAMDFHATLAVCGVLGVALSAQSPAVVMALLAETRAEGPLSQVILGSVVVADLVVITMYSVAATVATAALGASGDVLGVALSVTWELFGSIAFGMMMGATIGAFLRHVNRSSVLFAIVVCLVVAEVGTRIHIDPLITMLAAGIWLENVSKNAHTLLREIEQGRLPLFLVFFAVAGSHIDIAQLAALIVPVAILAVARATAFWLGSTIASARSHAPPVVRKYAWFGLVPQSGLALALALLVQRTFPTFGNAAAVVVFGVVGLNELISPVILRVLLLRSGEAGKKTDTDLVVAAGH
jgi:Kef-type K+ transport system membrane component KefB